jgi:hypothetical protein
MYRIDRNDYNETLKSNIVYTPDVVVAKIWSIIDDSGYKYNTILDPAVGKGALMKDKSDCIIVGVDTEDHKLNIDKFVCKKFEETIIEDYVGYQPDLIVMNPPFAGHPSRLLYPEVFLRHATDLFGDIPTVMICPPNLRLNQRKSSKRWKWLFYNIEINGILTLPIDIFDNVLFHTEVLFMNFPSFAKIKPHSWLEELL